MQGDPVAWAVFYALAVVTLMGFERTGFEAACLLMASAKVLGVIKRSLGGSCGLQHLCKLHGSQMKVRIFLSENMPSVLTWKCIRSEGSDENYLFLKYYISVICSKSRSPQLWQHFQFSGVR